MSNFRCSGRWRWGWSASATKTLSSNHTLKPLVPPLCLAGVVAYGLAEKLRNFVTGIFIPQYHYPYAVALCFAQVVVSLLALNLLHVLDVVPLRCYSRPLGERVLVPAICSSVHAVLAMWAKGSSSCGGLDPLSLPLLPVVTAAFSFLLKLSPPPSVHMSVLISILSGACIVTTASQSLAGIEPLEYLYAPLALTLHALSLTWLAKVHVAERRHSPGGHASVFDVYHALLVNQSWVLGLLWLLHPDGPRTALSRGSWHSLLFHGYLLAILLLGMLLNFAAVAAALCFSPLAAALLHSARQLGQLLAQLP